MISNILSKIIGMIIGLFIIMGAIGFLHIVCEIANYAHADKYECLCTEYRGTCNCKDKK